MKNIPGSVSEGGHAGANWVRKSITINTGFGEKRFRDGNIEELLIHEGAHVSLDNFHKDVSFETTLIIFVPFRKNILLSYKNMVSN